MNDSLLRRYQQIAAILAKYGFAEFLQHDEKLARLIPTTYLQRERALSRPQKLRLALEEMGPAFIKLGQFLSMRDDLLPKEYTDELAKLTDRVESMPYAALREAVKRELGKYPEEFFKSFSKAPIGSASIGQVHKARLKSGRLVVVKVQRPNIRRTIEEDLAIMAEIASLAERRSKDARDFHPRRLVEYFKESILRELDYDHELRNAQKFKDFFSEEQRVVIPAVYPNYSTKRLLVMEYVEGISVLQWLATKPSPAHRKSMANFGTELFLRQILEFGHFQQDPHGGNFLIAKTGKKAVLLDFGMIGFIDEQSRQQLVDLFLALMNKDAQGVVEAMDEMGAIEDDSGKDLLRRQVSEIIDEYYSASLEKLDMQSLFSDLTAVLREHRVVLPQYFIALIRMLVTVEALAKRIYPRYNFAAASAPFVKRSAEERLRPQNILRSSFSSAVGASRLFASLPKRLAGILSKAERGKMEVRLMHENISPLSASLEDISNKVSLSVLTAALILASATLVANRIGPLYDGYSILGIVGYGFSAIIGIYLILIILTSAKFSD